MALIGFCKRPKKYRQTNFRQQECISETIFGGDSCCKENLKKFEKKIDAEF